MGTIAPMSYRLITPTGVGQITPGDPVNTAPLFRWLAQRTAPQLRRLAKSRGWILEPMNQDNK